MDAYEGITGLGGSSLAVEPGQRLSYGAGLSSGSSILVGGDGSRYLREDESPRHGHVYYAGTWVSPQRPDKSYVVADQKQYDKIAPSLAPAIKEQVLQADTLTALAEIAGMNPDILTSTVETFNTYAKTGKDLQLGRSAASMTAFSDGPFYAIEIIAGILNTQGGPRRNENAQILDVNGTPIPHLYSAGELGGITSLQYQGGGNIAECIIFGEIAGKNAAATKDALPAYSAPTAVESTLLYTPGATSDIGKSESSAPEVTLGENEYLGVGDGGMGGPIYVKVTMDDTKIAKVEIVQHAESAGISDPAIEKLPAAIVAANSADVDAISGATLTSTGIKNAVKDALSQVK